MTTLVALLIGWAPGGSLPPPVTPLAGPGVGAPIVAPDRPVDGSDGSTPGTTAPATPAVPIRFGEDSAPPDGSERTADPAARPDDPSTGSPAATEGPSGRATSPAAGNSASHGAETPKEVAGSKGGPKEVDGRKQGSARSPGRGTGK